VLLGNGDGTFQTARTVDPGLPAFFPRSLAVGEFDGDHFADLAIAFEDLQGHTSVLVLAGNGDGSFHILFSKSFDFMFMNAGQIAVADLRRNGKQDLILPVDHTNGGGVDILLGNGNGTFADQGLIRTGVVPSAVAVGDFDGSGIPDLAVTNFLNDSVSVLMGRGDGSFRAPVNYSVGGRPRSVRVARLEGSSQPFDIVTANLASNGVSILRGNGDGTFQAEVRYLTGGGPSAVVVADFNGDGAPDLATANAISDNVTVLLNRNDGLAPRGATRVRPHGSAVRVAVDALFTGTRVESPQAVIIGQQLAAAARDDASSPRGVETPTAQPALAYADTIVHRSRHDRAGMADDMWLGAL
jgi:hypothetical protein